jgi:nucleoside 2-deoxyribosyltransferase
MNGSNLGKVYLASGWFSPEWLEEVENIKSVFDEFGISYFSPKDENLCDNDASESMQDQIFSGNIKHLHECDWMLCNTRNKDMGSIFEAGYMNCLNKPIVYFCDGLPPGAQFNLMLAASGLSVCTSLKQLRSYLKDCIGSGKLVEARYQGEIE